MHAGVNDGVSGRVLTLVCAFTCIVAVTSFAICLNAAHAADVHSCELIGLTPLSIGSTMSNVFGKTVPTPKFFCNGCGHNQQPMGG